MTRRALAPWLLIGAPLLVFAALFLLPLGNLAALSLMHFDRTTGGDLTLRDAFARSSNIAAVRVDGFRAPSYSITPRSLSASPSSSTRSTVESPG